MGQVGVVWEVEVLVIAEAEEVDAVVVRQNEAVDHQVRVDLPKDQDLINHLRNLQTAMQLNHQGPQCL